MLSIQEVGSEVLGNNPRTFYAFCGTEYGIKKKYIDHLSNLYGNIKEVKTVNEILSTMSTKHLIPLTPCVYVIRYDDTFISSLNDKTAEKIKNTKIVGTIVCLYEDMKHLTKLEKFLPEFTVSIDPVNPQFLCKYLKNDFPELPERIINIVVTISSDYNQAHNMCYCLNLLDSFTLTSLNEYSISQLVGHQFESTEKQIQLGVASRNFKYLINVIDRYDDDSDRVLYTILQTMIELDKLLDNPKASSDLKDYIKVWSRADVYYMFMHTYDAIKKSRSSASVDPSRILIQLFGLLQFNPIPSLEVMS